MAADGKFALNVSSSQDYYPFGSVMEGRKYNLSAYRYAFNTQERMPELNESHYTALYWEYDGRLARRWNRDPKPAVGASDYAINGNSPLQLNDPNGDCPPGIDCENPLPIMQVRLNRASNLMGNVRNNSKKFHAGHDLYAPVGTPVFSVMTGKVIATGYSSTYGNYVTIAHFKPLTEQQIRDLEDPNKADKVKLEVAYYSFYAHLDKVNVESGQYLNKGQKIGEVGTTGNANNLEGDNVHLHFEFGTKLRSETSPFLDKKYLLDPNIAYKNTSFVSQNPQQSNQNIGVFKTVFVDGLSYTKIFTFKQEFKNSNKAGKTSFYGSSVMLK
ncbi:MAG: hypothetical protein KatS3mg034_1171 [Vicingaceae bacterium]|nr:MAG: hypothetical protein KatS3mg034_1171 [Vicingaceae bacterium]